MWYKRDMLDYFFHWYTGAVWSNIIASALWAIPTVVIGFWRLKKHQRKHHEQQMAALRVIHREVRQGNKDR